MKKLATATLVSITLFATSSVALASPFLSVNNQTSMKAKVYYSFDSTSNSGGGGSITQQPQSGSGKVFKTAKKFTVVGVSLGSLPSSALLGNCNSRISVTEDATIRVKINSKQSNGKTLYSCNISTRDD